MKPLDIEDVLQEMVGGMVDYPCCAPPIPVDLSAPQVVFMRTGGASWDLVVDEHDVLVHCYGESWASAQTMANEISEAIKRLPYIDGVVNGSSLNTLPYNNTDPNHETIPRVTFSALVTCRSERSH